MKNAVRLGLLDQCSRGVPPRADAEWTPTPAQIAELEMGARDWFRIPVQVRDGG